MTERKTLIAGNWKMFKTAPEAAAVAGELKSLVSHMTDVDAMVAPQFTALASVGEALKGSGIFLAGQDVFWETEGAFTGQISVPMLKAVGCTHVIIGHSECRQFFGETDETVNKKVKAALSGGLIPVVCVGESETERDAGKTFSVIEEQLTKGLEGIDAAGLGQIIIAYEPVWAIGTGKTASNDQAQEVHRAIREWMEKTGGNSIAKALRILYGGSVKPDNIAGLIAMDDIDGALVGGASLTADSFAGIVRPCSRVAGDQV